MLCPWYWAELAAEASEETAPAAELQASEISSHYRQKEAYSFKAEPEDLKPLGHRF